MIIFLIFMKLVGFIDWLQFFVIALFEVLRKLYESGNKQNEN